MSQQQQQQYQYPHPGMGVPPSHHPQGGVMPPPPSGAFQPGAAPPPPMPGSVGMIPPMPGAAGMAPPMPGGASPAPPMPGGLSPAPPMMPGGLSPAPPMAMPGGPGPVAAPPPHGMPGPLPPMARTPPAGVPPPMPGAPVAAPPSAGFPPQMTPPAAGVPIPGGLVAAPPPLAGTPPVHGGAMVSPPPPAGAAAGSPPAVVTPPMGMPNIGRLSIQAEAPAPAPAAAATTTAYSPAANTPPMPAPQPSFQQQQQQQHHHHHHHQQPTPGQMAQSPPQPGQQYQQFQQPAQPPQFQATPVPGQIPIPRPGTGLAAPAYGGGSPASAPAGPTYHQAPGAGGVTGPPPAGGLFPPVPGMPTPGAPGFPAMGGMPAPPMPGAAHHAPPMIPHLPGTPQGAYPAAGPAPAHQPGHFPPAMGGNMPPGFLPPGAPMGGMGGTAPGGMGGSSLTRVPLALDDPGQINFFPSPPRIDESPFSVVPINHCDPQIQSCTVGMFPANSSVANKSKVPLGLFVSPFLSHLTKTKVPTATGRNIVRCRRCRAYINPYVTFVENNTRWKCCMCSTVNDGYPTPDVRQAVIEYVATESYLQAAPQAPAYIFVIDVSSAAVRSGMLAVACQTIKASLDRLPNKESRLKIGFITVDDSLHFYNLSASRSRPDMLVIPQFEESSIDDLDSITLPIPSGLLVHLTESRNMVEMLLDSLPGLFKDQARRGNCLGAALNAAFKLLGTGGGKVCVFQATLPDTGPYILTNRAQPAGKTGTGAGGSAPQPVVGTNKESALLSPQTTSSQNLALAAIKSDVSFDFFLFGSGPDSAGLSRYLDLASLTHLPRVTSGVCYYYPSFNAGVRADVERFSYELGEYMATMFGLEAHFRVRVSRGVRLVDYHGPGFMRFSDLLALPATPPQTGYAVQLEIDESIAAPLVCFQTSILYTSSNGERRIRVITSAIPTTTEVGAVLNSVNVPAVVGLLSKMAVERALSSRVEDARDAILNKAIELLTVARSEFPASSNPVPAMAPQVGQNPAAAAASQIVAPQSLMYLPFLVLALARQPAFRGGVGVLPIDARSWSLARMHSGTSMDLAAALIPQFYSLHDFAPEVGNPVSESDPTIVMPPRLRLSLEVTQPHGIYLLLDGQHVFLFVRRQAHSSLLQELFGIPNYEALGQGRILLPGHKTAAPVRVANDSVPVSDYVKRIHAVIDAARKRNCSPLYQPLILLREDAASGGGSPPERSEFLVALLEDRCPWGANEAASSGDSHGSGAMSYSQFIRAIRTRMGN